MIGSHIFEKHRIPDVLNLIGIGVLLGPLLHMVDSSLLTPWMPHVGAMALGLILFEGGLDLDLSDVVHRFGLSFALATATFLANMAATGAPWVPALLLGAVLDEKIRWFNTEATFFARTFFFVYLGLVISLRAISWEFLRISLAIFCAVLICRFLVVRLLRLLGDEGNYELAYFAMVPRGLTSAVLAAMAWGSGIPGTEIFLEYAFVTILLTNFCMTGLIRKAEAASGDGRDGPAAARTGSAGNAGPASAGAGRTGPRTPEPDLIG